jgi:hypothetical protein
MVEFAQFKQLVSSPATTGKGIKANNFGVADLGYEGLNMQVRETSIHKTSGFSSYFFHTLIKQLQGATTRLKRLFYKLYSF